MQKDPSRRRFPPADRLIEVIDDTLTGEVLLDEAAGGAAAVRVVVEPVFFADCCCGTVLSLLGLRVEPTSLRNREFMDDIQRGAFLAVA